MSAGLGRIGARVLAAGLFAACRGAPPGTASPSAPESAVPGSRAFRAPPIRRRAIEYRFQAPPGSDPTRGPLPMGRTTLSESAATVDGEPAILQVIAVPERGLVDSLLVRRRDLAPVREHDHYRGRYIGVEFSGRTIHWLRRAADGAEQSGDTTYGVPVFAFNQLEMLVRALALPPGRPVVVPMLSEGSAELELDTLMVEPTEPPTVRFADSAVVARYRLDGSERAVVSHEIVVRDGGARYVRVSY